MPHPQCDYQQFDKALDRSHVYRVSTSLLSRATVGSPAVGILKAAGRYTYKQRTPAHLEYISTFRTSKNTKPNFFPLDDFHVKITMDDANEFPDFILFLKEANIKLGSHGQFSSLRQEGVDHNLFIGNPNKNPRTHKSRTNSHREPVPSGL
jgi:hypothetical protein